MLVRRDDWPTELVVHADLRHRQLVLNVDEFDIRKVKVGQTVKISAGNSEGTEYEGIVMKININGTTVNGVTSYPVTVRIDNAGDLLPGMNVDAKIEVESLKDVLSIPSGIVARNGQVLVKTGETASGTGKPGSQIPAGFAYKKVDLGGSNDDYIEVVDGLKEGDIVSVDCGAVIDGFYGDSAITVPVGEKIDPETARLLKVTEASLHAGIAVVKPGATLGDIGAAVQGVVEAEGFSVVRDFVGHGIGSNMHEDPQIPNYGEAGRGMKLRAGMVIAIEPMVNAGQPDVKVLRDGWTAVTNDGSMSAHFEHTLAVTDTGARILTE